MTCNCSNAGWCETYKRNMTERQLLICQDKVLSPEKCDAMRFQWSQMAGNHEQHEPLGCEHRGIELRRELCTTCPGTVYQKVYQCDLHGECTIKSCQNNQLTNMRFVTNADLARDTLKLLRKIPTPIAGVAGIPRSGMIPASLLATTLHLPLYALTHRGLHPVGCGWRLSDTVHLPREGPMLVVDDTSMYGNAMAMARTFWQKFSQGTEALFATVYCSPTKYHRHGPMPDMYAVELDDPHFLEWCYFNCGYARRSAFDFDGVLTMDGTERPLYKPLKYPVELIVTGRLERERVRSDKWLEYHGIRYKKMIMWPGTLEERNAADPLGIAEFKAKYFKKSSLDFFVESHPKQAEEIARLSKKLVICPTNAKVYR